MFALPDSWVWDFWTVDDGEQYHLFFLFASRALHDPGARHYRAGVGHAVSSDLVHWTRVQDAIVHGEPGEFDDLATWTGSITRHPDGTWLMFYTGASLAPSGSNMQRIGLATSPDLLTWTKQGLVAEADPRWYEQLDGGWHDWAFRDPWGAARSGRRRLAHADHRAWQHRTGGRARCRRARLEPRPARNGRSVRPCRRWGRGSDSSK